MNASKAINCEEIAAELVTQPDLLTLLDAADGTRPALLFSEKSGGTVQRYTGERITEKKMLEVGALRLLGASDREIESVCHVTRRSIPAILAQLEKSKQITPLRDRVTAMVGDNAERSSLLLKRLLDRGLDGEVSLDLAAMLKAVGSVNCFQVEKFQLLTGQPTEIIEQRTGAGRDEIEKFWQSITPISATVTEAGDWQSTAGPAKGQAAADDRRAGG